MAEFTSNAYAGEPKGPPQACLFVANLPGPEVAEDRVKEHFSYFGEVLKLKLIKDRSSRPYAFIQFAHVESANDALKSTRLMDGKRLRVEKAKVNRTLFIAKLSRNLTNGQLREQAEAFGEVESVTIIKNHQTNKSKGCGFVKYVYREDSMDAFVGLKNANRKWIIEWATSTNDPDSLGVDKFNIFIGGLNSGEATKEALEAKFGAYGEIESVTLINKENGDDEPDGLMVPQSATSRSAFAFVRYTDPPSSAAAIEAENGQEWLGRRIRVQYCESAEMKTKRRATKYSQPTPNSPPPAAQQSHSTPVQNHHHNPAPFNSHSQPTAHQYYQQPRVPTPIVSAPMLVMGGLPIYTSPIPTTNANNNNAAHKYNNFGRKGREETTEPSSPTVYSTGIPAYPINPALLAYAQQPWIFAHQAHLQGNQAPHTHQSGGGSSHLRSRHHQPQYRSREGVPSPSSDDSLGNDVDGGLTQSMAAWVLK